ncbi:hypothetical protein AB4304_13890 [Vibrio breoganii]
MFGFGSTCKAIFRQLQEDMTEKRNPTTTTAKVVIIARATKKTIEIMVEMVKRAVQTQAPRFYSFSRAFGKGAKAGMYFTGALWCAIGASVIGLSNPLTTVGLVVSMVALLERGIASYIQGVFA